MSAITTFAPSATKPRAWLAPIPRAPPVMITVRLSKRFMTFFSLHCLDSLSCWRGGYRDPRAGNQPRALPLPLDAMSTSDLLRMCGADETWWRHDTGCDLVERVVGKKARAAAPILRVGRGHQGSFLRRVVRRPLG